MHASDASATKFVLSTITAAKSNFCCSKYIAFMSEKYIPLLIGIPPREHPYFFSRSPRGTLRDEIDMPEIPEAAFHENENRLKEDPRF